MDHHDAGGDHLWFGPAFEFSNSPRRIPNYNGIGLDILSNHGSSTNHADFSDGYPC